MINVINVDSGQVFDKGPLVNAAIEMAVAKHGNRMDSMDLYRAELAKRQDSFSATSGLFLERELNQVLSKVLEEKVANLSALKLFGANTDVKPGAKTFSQKRLYNDGEAAVFAGGSNIPRVGISAVDEQFKTHIYVTSFGYEVFTDMSGKFAGVNVPENLARVARIKIDQFLNKNSWHGNAIHKIYGVLNYPWLPKKVIATPFNSSSQPIDIYRALCDLANTPAINTQGTMTPNKMAISTRLYHYISETPMSTTNPEYSIKKHFLDNNGYITEIIPVYELQGVGPGETDGILCYVNDATGIQNRIVQATTALPDQVVAFEKMVYFYMIHGNITMFDAGYQILGWAEA